MNFSISGWRLGPFFLGGERDLEREWESDRWREWLLGEADRRDRLEEGGGEKERDRERRFAEVVMSARKEMDPDRFSI